VNWLVNLQPGEVFVLSGLLAVSMFTVASIFGMSLAHILTREPTHAGQAVIAHRAASANVAPVQERTGLRSPMATAG
jgi:hypothetical protein